MSMNQNSGYGRALLDTVRSMVPVFGRVFVVMNSNDSTDYKYSYLQDIYRTDPDGQVRFFTDLSTAVDACQTNNNNVILLDSHTSHKVSSMLTISKNKIHFIGMDGGDRLTNQRALISNTGAGSATDVSMIKITGSGCTFRNIKFANNWTVAQNLYAVEVNAGSNVLFKNCTIQNLGSAHLTNANAASLHLTGAEDVEFVDCTLGQDTLKITVASGHVVLTDGATTRVTFKNCLFRLWTSQTTGVMYACAGNGSNDLQLFRNCAFCNRVNGGATAAVAVSSDASTAGDIVFDTTTFASGVTDFATAAVGNTGMFIAAPVPTAGTSGIAVQPTA